MGVAPPPYLGAKNWKDKRKVFGIPTFLSITYELKLQSTVFSVIFSLTVDICAPEKKHAKITNIEAKGEEFEWVLHLHVAPKLGPPGELPHSIPGKLRATSRGWPMAGGCGRRPSAGISGRFLHHLFFVLSSQSCFRQLHYLELIFFDSHLRGESKENGRVDRRWYILVVTTKGLELIVLGRHPAGEWKNTNPEKQGPKFWSQTRRFGLYDTLFLHQQTMPRKCWPKKAIFRYTISLPM